MNRATDAALGALLAIAALAAIGTPAPRLVALGCDTWPSVRLAREESDITGTCKSVRRLPFVTE